MNSYNKLRGKNIDKIQNKKEIPEQLQSELDKHAEEGNKYFDNNEYDKALEIWMVRRIMAGIYALTVTELLQVWELLKMISTTEKIWHPMYVPYTRKKHIAAEELQGSYFTWQ